MFKCKNCETLEKEVAFLREANAKLVDRIMALADARAYSAVTASVEKGSDYFGGGDDEMIAFNEYGQRILVRS